MKWKNSKSTVDALNFTFCINLNRGNISNCMGMPGLSLNSVIKLLSISSLTIKSWGDSTSEKISVL